MYPRRVSSALSDFPLEIAPRPLPAAQPEPRLSSDAPATPRLTGATTTDAGVRGEDGNSIWTTAALFTRYCAASLLRCCAAAAAALTGALGGARAGGALGLLGGDGGGEGEERRLAPRTRARCTRSCCGRGQRRPSQRRGGEAQRLLRRCGARWGRPREPLRAPPPPETQAQAPPAPAPTHHPARRLPLRTAAPAQPVSRPRWSRRPRWWRWWTT